MVKPRIEDLPARIRARIVVDQFTGCWVWQGCQRHGYGRIRWTGRLRDVHRVVFELLVGPIPAGLVLDHVQARGCRSTACCWPAHLEPVTRRENALRGDTFQATNTAKTHCPQGHEYTPENTWIDSQRGGRACRACKRDRSRVRRLQKPEQVRWYHREYMRVYRERRSL